MAFLQAFQQRQVQLGRINRSYMVLIPKKPGAVAMDAFRPICLQNCSIKILSKMLTRRLQKEIGNLIDLHQTGFLKGRSISETFVFAAELIQTCNKRRLPTLVLKLDFAKAFDTVIWESLDTILKARGFHDRWCAWMRDTLSSSKSAVLVNGCPGPWITCKQGLRQGDPLSSYLFLLVADSLQAMIRSAATVRSPVDSDSPCAVLQYADDTLLVLRGDVAEVQALKNILQAFSEATGLKINYSKSTLVSIHMDAGLAADYVTIMGKDSTVQQAINSNLHGCFVNRMSTQANDELQQLKVILQQTQLTDQPDTRLSAFSRTKDKLDTSAIYRLLKAQGHQDDPSSAFIWKNATPPRVQMFFWLLLRGRIQCRANLYRKNIMDLPNCLVCGMDDETPDHLIFECPIASQFWRVLGIQPDGLHCRNWHHIQRVSGIPDDQYSAFIMMCCWVLWKRQNAFVFRDEVIPIRTIFLQCKSESAN
ncbi:unnamed protein product [Miscanthus lutarioriparius]|uniref:Reverse transcriptase domain-containing protein n=1 Tax=Miscanthus lutarioriparius TaxID=422564 RepID=A0A811S1L7_9POAL|nr:unnamed protein product [Miscanthus lutarioriparius]